MSACSSCSNGNGSIAGCNNNGGCLTGGCNKMNVFDWLSNMERPGPETFILLHPPGSIAQNKI